MKLWRLTHTESIGRADREQLMQFMSAGPQTENLGEN